MTRANESPTPFEQVGGRAAVLRLTERFYDLMDEQEPQLARLHVLDDDGRVSRASRDRFGLFLLGWLGGPDDYVKQHGHPRLRMRHARVSVNKAQRDAWLRCMFQAMTEAQLPPSVDSFLRQRFGEVADFLRNAEEPD